MFPVIFQIGPVPVYSYGLMVALAFIVCSYLAEVDAKRVGLRPGLISDLIFWVAVFGILGARIFFVFTHLDEFFPDNALDVIMIQKGGLSFQGGLIAALLVGAVFIRRYGLSWRMMLDLCAPYAALGQAIGRIGCFLNGCCFGRHWDHGIYFPVHHDTLYPTQLFDAAGLLIIFFILKFQWFILPALRTRGAKASSVSPRPLLERGEQRGSSGDRGAQPSGIIFAQYLMLAPALRFTVEFFRGDHEALVYAGLSLYQWVCVGLFLAGLGILLKTRATRDRR